MSYEPATQAQLFNEALDHLRMAKGAMQADDAKGLWLHTGEAMLHAQLLPEHQEREIVRLTSTMPKTEALGAYKVPTAPFNAQEAYSHLRAAQGALQVGDLCGLAIWKGEAAQRASMLPEPSRSQLMAQVMALPDPSPDAVHTSCMSKYALGSNGSQTASMQGGVPRMLGLAATAGVIAFILLAGRKEHKPRELNEKEAKRLGKRIGIDWSAAPFTPDDLRRGIEVEMEHGPGGPAGYHGDVTFGDLEVSARIALAHLAEHPRYYDYLEAAEYRFEHGLEPNGPADEAAWMLHESDVALEEATDCFQVLDFDCAQSKGREARELAVEALYRSRRSLPWRRRRAERRAQAQYDRAHNFLWDTFYAKRPGGRSAQGW